MSMVLRLTDLRAAEAPKSHSQIMNDVVCVCLVYLWRLIQKHDESKVQKGKANN